MTRLRPAVPTVANTKVLCPYCGAVSVDPRRCDLCRGHFDPLSRQATQNAMGPWFIRDETSPWRPGCSIETLRELIRRGKVTRDTIIRGPGTKQFWNFAGRTPSVANLLGNCHNCQANVKHDDYSCKACGAVFTPDADRQHMGLAPVHLLPGDASPEMVAAKSMETPEPTTVSAKAAPASPPPAVEVPVPVSSPVQADRRPALEPRESRAGLWIAVVAVIALIAMGSVVALVMTGNLKIPGIADDPVVQKPPTSVKPPAPVKIESEPEAPKPAPQPVATAPTGSSAPSPAPTEAPPKPVVINLETELMPLLNKVPFDEAAMLAKIDELRTAHPELAKDLEPWAAAAKLRGQQLKLKKLP